MTTASGSFRIAVNTTKTNALDLSGPVDRLDLSIVKRLAAGAGATANSIDRHWHDERSLGSGATDALDLASLSGGGIEPTTSLSRLRLLLIENHEDSVGLLVIAHGGVNALPFMANNDDALEIPPGGAALLAAPKSGWELIGDSGQIDITASGGAASYRIVVLGNA